MIKKIFLLSMSACILALTFISCSDDENSEYSKEGLWMVTSYKFVNYNLTQDKILVQGEYTYDLEFTRNKDYIYCNILTLNLLMKQIGFQQIYMNRKVSLQTIS